VPTAAPVVAAMTEDEKIAMLQSETQAAAAKIMQKKENKHSQHQHQNQEQKQKQKQRQQAKSKQPSSGVATVSGMVTSQKRKVVSLFWSVSSSLRLVGADFKNFGNVQGDDTMERHKLCEFPSCFPSDSLHSTKRRTRQ
jgi:hypothetical protein